MAFGGPVGLHPVRDPSGGLAPHGDGEGGNKAGISVPAHQLPSLAHRTTQELEDTCCRLREGTTVPISGQPHDKIHRLHPGVLLQKNMTYETHLVRRTLCSTIITFQHRTAWYNSFTCVTTVARSSLWSRHMSGDKRWDPRNQDQQ